MLDQEEFERTFAQGDFEPSDYDSEEEAKNQTNLATESYPKATNQNRNQRGNSRKVYKSKRISKEQGNGADNEPIDWSYHIRAT